MNPSASCFSGSASATSTRTEWTLYLGCSWGSLSLHVANRYTHYRIVALTTWMFIYAYLLPYEIHLLRADHRSDWLDGSPLITGVAPTCTGWCRLPLVSPKDHLSSVFHWSNCCFHGYCRAIFGMPFKWRYHKVGTVYALRCSAASPHLDVKSHRPSEQRDCGNFILTVRTYRTEPTLNQTPYRGWYTHVVYTCLGQFRSFPVMFWYSTLWYLVTWSFWPRCIRKVASEPPAKHGRTL